MAVAITQEIYIKNVNRDNPDINTDKLVYINHRTKIDVSCKVCDHQWSVLPNSLVGRRATGCPVCSINNRKSPKRITPEEWRRRCSDKHNGKYTCDLSNYINQDTPIEIICPTHGAFLKKPSTHLHYSGCPPCGYVRSSDTRTGDTAQYITRVSKIHSGKYDYSKTIYTGSKFKLIVTCPVHGDFNIVASRHLRKAGCQFCSKELMGKSRTKGRLYFIEKACRVHGDKYDYTQAVYKDYKTKLRIVCPTHGVFEQTPSGHIAGSGCSECGSDQMKITQDVFFKRVTKLHPELILDDKTRYSRADKLVTVKCKTHGYFDRIASELMRVPRLGRVTIDCPKCESSAGELKLRQILTTLGFQFISEYKFLGSKWRYDFYIPELGILIEYDGEQHYRPISFFGGDVGYETIRQRDKDKDNLAKQRNAKLIRIPYTKYAELEEYFLWKLSKHYKYRYNNRYYRNYIQIVNNEKLPTDATVSDYDKYKTINITITKQCPV